MTTYDNMNKKEKNAKENVLKQANTLDGWPEIKGYDFDKEFKFE